MNKITKQALLDEGFRQDGCFFRSGKLSIFYCEEEDRFYVNHLYPFDYMVARMDQVAILRSVLSRANVHIFDSITLQTA